MIFKNLNLKNQTTNKYQLLTKIIIKFNKILMNIQFFLQNLIKQLDKERKQATSGTAAAPTQGGMLSGVFA